MASFQVERRDTGIQYTIKVGEFLLRDTFDRYTNSDGGVQLIKPNGYTEFNVMGDNVVEKLGLDALKQGAEYFFVNNPDYYLRLENPTGSLINDYTRYVDPSAKISDYPETTIPILKVTRTYYQLSIYKNNTLITPFLPFKIFTDEKGNYTKYYIYTDGTSASPNYFPRFCFSFNQRLIARVSPYYFNYPLMLFPNRTIQTGGTNAGSLYWENPTYIGTSFYLRNTPKLTGNGNFGLHIYNTDEYIYTESNITPTYGMFSNKSVMDTVSAIQPVSNYTTNIFPSFNVDLLGLNNNIAGMSAYDFFYSLLFDTLSETDPYPDNNGNGGDGGNTNPSGQTPPTTGGNPNGGDNTSDDIPLPNVPVINPINTGSVNLYEMSSGTFRQFMAYLWTNPFYTAIIKLFTDPMQCVISTHLIGVSVPTNRTGDIVIGNVNTNIKANIVDNNFIEINFGSLTINEYYKDSNDYDSIVELYLPYYGSVTLNTQEVMNATLTLSYIIDVLTGTFVAFVQVSKTIDGTNLNSVLYQYNGNMAYQIPISGADYSSFISTALSLTAGAITKTPTPRTDGTTINSGQANISIGYERSGNLSANTGYMGIKSAYVTILRPIHSLPPNFAKYIGFPYEGYVSLGSCTGITICREVYIDNVIGSVDETEEIKRLLKEGVIF